jgi:hypothetical protein
VSPFEELVESELAELLRAGVPPRAVRITVREMLIVRMERGPLGAREVSEAVEAAVRAACRLVRQLGTPDDLVETVCGAALEAVRGHGGESARWLAEATRAAAAVIDDLLRERAGEPVWPWGPGRFPRG